VYADGKDEFVKAALNRPALGAFPPVGWAELLESGLMKVAPKGMDQCTTTLCGSSANGQLIQSRSSNILIK
jgi:4-aminobutyrate aminotransferase/(S)-3-amino-2-methylpropionate transaminase